MKRHVLLVLTALILASLACSQLVAWVEIQGMWNLQHLHRLQKFRPFHKMRELAKRRLTCLIRPCDLPCYFILDIRYPKG